MHTKQCTLVCNENENKNEHIKVYMHAHTNTHRYPFVRTDTCAHRSGKFSIVGGALDTEPRMRMREKINKRISCWERHLWWRWASGICDQVSVRVLRPSSANKLKMMIAALPQAAPHSCMTGMPCEDCDNGRKKKWRWDPSVPWRFLVRKHWIPGW